MSTTVTPGRVRNGVDTERLFATLDAVGAQPEIAAFSPRPQPLDRRGHNRSVIKDFRGAGGGGTCRAVPLVLGGPGGARHVLLGARAAGPRDPAGPSAHMHRSPDRVPHRGARRGVRRRAARASLGRSLERVSREGVVMAAAISEPHQDLTRPATTARRTAEGWAVDGRKIFCTMSPAATLLYTAVTFEDEDGAERYGYAQVSADATGVRMHDNWDALGMRASGSQSVSFEDVRLPPEALRGGFPAGRLTGDWMDRNLNAGAFHATASVGIAEAAHDGVLAALASRGGAEGSPRAQTLAAENSIELSAIRRCSTAPARCSTSTTCARPLRRSPTRRWPISSPRCSRPRRSSTRRRSGWWTGRSRSRAAPAT